MKRQNQLFKFISNSRWRDLISWVGTKFWKFSWKEISGERFQLRAVEDEDGRNEDSVHEEVRGRGHVRPEAVDVFEGGRNPVEGHRHDSE